MLSWLLLSGVAAAVAVSNVQPQAGPPGTSFLFFASGFAADEPVGIWLNAPDGRVVPASAPELRRTTAFGDASWSWTAPQDATQGAWQMVAHGVRSAVEQVIPFTIGQPAPAAGTDQPFGVDPADGTPGTLFRFFAAGFADREFVYVSVAGPGGTLKSPNLVVPRTAAPNGRVDGSWTSPADATPGAWRIVIESDHSGVTRTIPVIIDSTEASPAPQMMVQPPTAAPGARFVVSATGFRAREPISVWLNTPDGRVVAAEIEGTSQAAPDGRAGWTWVAPADAPRGAWQMVAHGRESGIEVVAGFRLQ
jgi:hypothetical protein